MDPPRAAYIYDYCFLWLAYTTLWRLAASLPHGFSHCWMLLPPPLSLLSKAPSEQASWECFVSTSVQSVRCPVVMLQRGDTLT